jgi:hypothetical protein
LSSIIDATTFSLACKELLTELEEQLEAAHREERLALSVSHNSAGIELRQYQAALAEVTSEDEGKRLVIDQYVKRNALVNAVVRAHGARIAIAWLSDHVDALIRRVGPQTEPVNQLALVHLKRYRSLSTDGDIMEELGKVPDLERSELLDSIFTVFRDKTAKSGLFADVKFPAMPVKCITPTLEHVTLATAVQRCIALSSRMKVLHSAWVRAYSRYNRFGRRLEDALNGKSEEAFDRVLASRVTAQAELFVAGREYIAAHGQCLTMADELEEALKAAAAQIPVNLTDRAIIAMSNYIGADRWLLELRVDAENEYVRDNPEAVLAELAFDADRYITG